MQDIQDMMLIFTLLLFRDGDLVIKLPAHKNLAKLEEQIL